MAHYIAPSLLAADFLHLGRDIQTINSSEADFLHIDIMDGSFVPNISFGQTLLPFIKEASLKPLDIHLMINDPDRYLNEFADLGAHFITVHLEACNHLHRTIQKIHALGVKAGVAINPHTSVDLLDDIMEEVELVLIMSVNPGYGGQKFIYRTLSKIGQVKEKMIQRNLKGHIEIDGGVGLQNAASIINAGADILVAGSSVFKSPKPVDTIQSLKDVLKQ